MAEYYVEDTDLVSIADAIRSKTHGAAGLAFPNAFVSAIQDDMITGLVTESDNNQVNSDFATRQIVNYVNYTVSSIRVHAFADCKSLTTVRFKNCSVIANYAFQNTLSLNKIYLLSTSVVNLSSSNAFSDSNFNSTQGTVYVPATLLNTYKVTTNWTYYSTRFSGM